MKTKLDTLISNRSSEWMLAVTEWEHDCEAESSVSIVSVTPVSEAPEAPKARPDEASHRPLREERQVEEVPDTEVLDCDEDCQSDYINFRVRQAG